MTRNEVFKLVADRWPGVLMKFEESTTRYPHRPAMGWMTHCSITFRQTTKGRYGSERGFRWRLLASGATWRDVWHDAMRSDTVPKERDVEAGTGGATKGA